MNWQSGFNALETTFAPTLERWYEHHKRDLPWRHTRDPYCIWLSEIILQQTRVAQGKPYYERFINAYPTVADMARAEERDLLRLWQGLGYYSRARNLHQTARYVTHELSGKFPDNFRDLLKMKGIGVYTAAAIASFAFGERVPVVDGNVYRVLARVFGIDEDITTTTAKKTFARLADQLIQAAGDPATFNQAIMEFGAIQCTPLSPDCLLCPLQQQCNAYLTGRQQRLPVKARKAAVRERFFNYLVFKSGDKIALRERTARDVWQNLYDFCLLETDEVQASWRELTLPEPLVALVAEGKLVGSPVQTVQLLSHQRIRAVFYTIELPLQSIVPLPVGLDWYTIEEAGQLPKPVLVTNYLEKWFG
ncbi:A/G-specific adenine glycosylase [Spirosoma utsteinense]|uniref:Adenine DNA glycosylase n=1 Tax=Spirosoma utsteinense TaxID=2585773 RepID=A0ABR6W2V5_9BACT|nr:A/G-specific adenine glycosylase [Spirosoma utsteinense]MBC3784292.1 A/G-specific adenine glycosylase [Spirosoma utsteinense]MBC3790910.1 A/G-specific adenine glycosylase [Spirosoma utsteinense]